MPTLCLRQNEHPPLTQAYLRPFDLLEARGMDALSVTHSLKFAPDSLDAERYFIRFPGSHIDAGDIPEVCRSLGMPALAEAWVQTAAGGWGQAGSIGAARMKDAVAYRAYFRSGVEQAGKVYGRAVEWTAGDRAIIAHRDYILLDASSAEEARAVVSDALKLSASSAEAQVLDAWCELLRSKAGS